MSFWQSADHRQIAVEAAEMDGANALATVRIVTLPAIMPVLATVVTLRTIWMF
ncbi:ABC transporter permease subunit [Shigella flexneri]